MKIPEVALSTAKGVKVKEVIILAIPVCAKINYPDI